MIISNILLMNSELPINVNTNAFKNLLSRKEEIRKRLHKYGYHTKKLKKYLKMIKYAFDGHIRGYFSNIIVMHDLVIIKIWKYAIDIDDFTKKARIHTELPHFLNFPLIGIPTLIAPSIEVFIILQPFLEY